MKLSLWLKTFFFANAAAVCMYNAAIAQEASTANPDLPPAEGLEAPDKEPEAAPPPDKVPPTKKGASAIPAGQELVNMDFPELTDIRDIIKAVSLWTGKNVILDRNVNGKVQIISPQKVTKEEAYQAFLSALNIVGLTTVETGKVIKILPVRTAVKGNLKTFLGSSWTPRTDEIITQIVPLKYVDAKTIQSNLSRIVSSNSLIAYEPTNTLIISDSGYKVRRVLDILELLDVQGQQPQIAIVPIKYSDAKSIADRLKEIFQASQSKTRKETYHSYKVLTDDRTNSVVVFGPPRTIKDIKALVKKFDTPVTDPSTQASIHVRPLDYADAKKLATTLSNLASSGNRNNNLRRPPLRSTPQSNGTASSEPALADLGDGVKITADESSNSLLITGSRSAYEAVNSIIRKLDIRRSQVFVEADILDIIADNGFGFGTSIFAGLGSQNGAKAITAWEAESLGPLIISQAKGDSKSSSDLASVAGAFASDMTIGILSAKEVNIPGLGSFSPGALIKMIKTDSNTKVLSSPHILTSNNEEATITVGEAIYFSSSQVSGTTGVSIPKVEKVDGDLTLKIKPNISHSSYITLNIDLESSSLGPINSITKLPSVNKRKSNQIVTARNGQTIVISGLVTNRELESFKKIPLLGDIPILGWLFRNSTIKSIRSNLAIFLTPHVIHGAEDLASIYKIKLKERDELLKGMYGKSGVEDEFYAKLPTEADGAYRPTPLDKDEQERINKYRRETYEDMGYGNMVKFLDTSAPRNDESTIPLPMTSGDGGGDAVIPSDNGAQIPSDPIEPPEPVEPSEPVEPTIPSDEGN